MKHITHITGIVLFIVLIPVLYPVYKIMDLFKVNTDLPEPEKPHEHNTTYPEYPTKSFNEWSQYINKQL